METICRDLKAEQKKLASVLAGLDENQWEMKTPFLNWRIKDEIRHLAYFDERAVLAATIPEAFNRHVGEVLNDFEAFERSLEQACLGMTPGELMNWWHKQGTILVDVLAGCNRKKRIPWYGPSMSALTLVTSRLMETWAHGQDIFDTLRIRRIPKNRLRHIAHLGVKTFAWTYTNRCLAVPEEQLRVELNGPSGDRWFWGPEDAENQIRGSAEDFCFVVTQCRHVDDTSLELIGEVARDWMEKAQCFAGPPTAGPRPGERVIRYQDPVPEKQQ